MSRSTLFKEDRELTELRAAEQRLRELEKECAELPKKLERERKERESTMPPLADFADRVRLHHYEETVSRGEITNVRRDQNRSLMLFFMLFVATASLVWWGLQLMKG